MSEQEILEGNKLIAEFMGGIYYLDTNSVNFTESFVPKHCKYFNLENLKFHSSWEWLMPVVENIKKIPKEDKKIRNMLITYSFSNWIRIEANYELNMMTDASYPSKDGFEYSSDSFNKDTPVIAVYKGVINFIKWYNLQND